MWTEVFVAVVAFESSWKEVKDVKLWISPLPCVVLENDNDSQNCVWFSEEKPKIVKEIDLNYLHLHIFQNKPSSLQLLIGCYQKALLVLIF